MDPERDLTVRTLQEILDDIENETPLHRFPIRNREPRVEWNPLKWCIIMERDGGVCYHCGVTRGTGGRMVLDHWIPRSAFLPEDIEIADRSDNLRVMCWNCNGIKSNYDYRYGPSRRPGVTAACLYCRLCPYCPTEDGWDPETNHGIFHQEHVPELPSTHCLAWCGRCHGYSDIPDKSWLL